MYARLRTRPYLLIGVAVVVFVTALAVRLALRHWQVARELERIRAAGEPVTPAELLAVYQTPPGAANATTAWQIPIAAIHNGVLGPRPYGISVLDGEGLPPRPGEAWPERERAAGFLQTHRAVLQQIDAALATAGECRYLDDFEGGYQTVLDHVQVMREITRLLHLRAWMHAHDGAGDKALADVIAAVNAAETLKHEPINVSHLVRLLRNQETLECLEALLPRLAATDAALSELQSRLARIDYRGVPRLVLIGERVDGLLAFNDAVTAGAGNTPTPVYRALIGEDQLAYLEVTRELLESVDGDWPAVLTNTQQFRAGSFDDLNMQAPWGGGTWVTPSGFVGPLRTLIERLVTETARTRAAIAAIAAVRFRSAEQRWPSSLAELSPNYLESAPIDPFTGKPLLMRASEDGLRIYSVGLDLRDDRGVENSVTENGSTQRRGTPDVAFFLQGE